jgi:hypothetical protein
MVNFEAAGMGGAMWSGMGDDKYAEMMGVVREI